jgi:hypothetical protein
VELNLRNTVRIHWDSLKRNWAFSFFDQGQRAPVLAFGFKELARFGVGSSESSVEFDQLPAVDVRVLRHCQSLPKGMGSSGIVPSVQK